MLQQRVAAVLAGLEYVSVYLGAQREAIRPVDPNRAKGIDGFGNVGRVALAVLAQRDRIMGRGFNDSPDPSGASAVKNGGVLGTGDLLRGPIELLQVDVLSAAIGVVELRPSDENGARNSTTGRTDRWRAEMPSSGTSSSASVRPRSVAPCRHPRGPRKSTSLRAASSQGGAARHWTLAE